MPTAPARLCSHPGCNKLAKHSHRAAYDERRGSASARGYDRHHQRWREMVLHRYPYCRQCDMEGRVTLATEADHVIPLRKGGGWALENGAGLCHSCHSQKTWAENH